MPFQFSNWLHADCLGNMKDLVLSLWPFKIFSMSAPKMIYINVCVITNLYASILHYSTHETLLMLGTYCILDSSAPKKNVSLRTWALDHSALDITRHLNTDSLGTWYHSALEHLFTQHLISLGTWALVHSALDITWHLIMVDHSALGETELLGTRLWLSSFLLLGMYNEKWLSVVTLNCQN